MKSGFVIKKKVHYYNYEMSSYINSTSTTVSNIVQMLVKELWFVRKGTICITLCHFYP